MNTQQNGFLNLNKHKLVYTGLLLLVLFFCIRIPTYSGMTASDSLFFLMISLFKNAILEGDYFLFPIGVLMSFELLFFIVCLLKKWSVFSLISIWILFVYVYFSIRGILDDNLFILSSIPFVTLSLFYLWVIWKERKLRV